MFDILNKLYLNNKIDEYALQNAVLKKWITEEEKERIINNK